MSERLQPPEGEYIGSINVDLLDDGRYSVTVATKCRFERLAPTMTLGTSVLLAARVMLDAQRSEDARLRAEAVQALPDYVPEVVT